MSAVQVNFDQLPQQNFAQFEAFIIGAQPGIYYLQSKVNPSAQLQFNNSTLPERYIAGGLASWDGIIINFGLCDWVTSFGAPNNDLPSDSQINTYLLGIFVPGPAVTAMTVNIYNSDGTITATQRTVSLNNNELDFETSPSGIFGVNYTGGSPSGINQVGFAVDPNNYLGSGLSGAGAWETQSALTTASTFTAGVGDILNQGLENAAVGCTSTHTSTFPHQISQNYFQAFTDHLEITSSFVSNATTIAISPTEITILPTLPNDNTQTNLLTQNSSTGQLTYRTASSFPNGTNIYYQSADSARPGNNIVTGIGSASEGAIILCSDSPSTIELSAPTVKVLANTSFTISTLPSSTAPDVLYYNNVSGALSYGLPYFSTLGFFTTSVIVPVSTTQNNIGSISFPLGTAAAVGQKFRYELNAGSSGTGAVQNLVFYPSTGGTALTSALNIPVSPVSGGIFINIVVQSTITAINVPVVGQTTFFIMCQASWYNFTNGTSGNVIAIGNGSILNTNVTSMAIDITTPSSATFTMYTGKLYLA